MANYILGYDTNEEDEPKAYATKELASYFCEEWCEVEADTLVQAKLRYEICFLEWKASQS